MTQRTRWELPADLKHWYRDKDGRVFWTNVVMSGVEPVTAPETSDRPARDFLPLEEQLELSLDRIAMLEHALREAREELEMWKERANEYRSWD